MSIGIICSAVGFILFIIGIVMGRKKDASETVSKKNSRTALVILGIILLFGGVIYTVFDPKESAGLYFF